MLGLLYKDYIAVKGKGFLILLFGQFCVFSLLRFTITNDEVIDGILLLMLIVLYASMAVFLMGQYASRLLKVDEGKKQKQYFLSLPIDKRQYVASKYLFLAIAFYILQSTFVFQIQIAAINVVSESAMQYVASIQTIVPAVFSVTMVFCAFDLLFYFGLGVEKAQRVINGIFFLILFGVVAYFLFGDLSLVEKFNLVAVIEYLKKHYEIMLGVQILTPLVAIVLYYICYLCSVKVFERREWEDA